MSKFTQKGTDLIIILLLCSHCS